MKSFSVHPAEIFRSLSANRELYWALLRRDISGRYKGSRLGLLWSFLHPLLMLSVYAFVFGSVFQSRWNTGGGSAVSYAVVLFCGLIVFNVFSETICRSPSLVVENSNYVKKVIFPLELLPLVSLGTSIFHAVISCAIWVVFYWAVEGIPHVALIFLPLVMLPLIMLTAGVAWFMAALGVFLRDVAQIVGVFTSALLFMSPIFYPLSAVPASVRSLIKLNPLTHFVEQARAVMIYGEMPDAYALTVQIVLSGIVSWLGFAWFQKTRKGFADVL